MFITKQVSIFSLKPVMLEICEATINKQKQMFTQSYLPCDHVL